MVESLLEWLSLHADQAHYIIFGLLVLTGLSVPISEDAMLIVSGILASTVIPDHTVHLFLGVFLGCFVSDCIAYGLGRHFGKRLTRPGRRFFSISESRLHRLNDFYIGYGFWTLFVGRFIPFGFRNGIFMTAGAGKMAFSRFALTDGISCLIFSAIVFFASYSCAQNYESVQYFMHHGGRLLLAIVLVTVLSIVGVRMWRRRHGAVRKIV